MDASTSVPKANKKRHYCSVCSNYRGKSVDNKTIILHKFPADERLRKAWIRRIKILMPQFTYNRHDRLCSAHFLDGKFTKEHNIPSMFNMKSKRKKFELSKCSLENSDTSQPNTIDLNADAASDFEKSKGQTTLKTTCCAEQISLIFNDYLGAVEEKDMCRFLQKDIQTYPITVHCNEIGVQTVSELLVTTVGTQTDDNYCSCQTETFVKVMQVASSTDITDIQVKQTKSIGIQVKRPDIAFEDISDSNEKCMFYTGIPDPNTIRLLFDTMTDDGVHTQQHGYGKNQGRPRSLRPMDEFILVLMRLRLGLLLQDLAGRFHISKTTCSHITNRWISYLSNKLCFLISWPSRALVNKYMPHKFKKKYPSCRVIIDCTEIYTETPQSLANKSLMYSNYKSHMTYKALIGISPSGLITFASDLWAGSISDKQLTQASGILEKCELGDSIMADKGFLISDLTTPRGIKLIIPPLKFRRFNRRQVEETRRIANLRIDVERAIERVKNFRIMQGVMPITLAQQASNIWKICVALANLQQPLVHDTEHND